MNLISIHIQVRSCSSKSVLQCELKLKAVDGLVQGWLWSRSSTIYKYFCRRVSSISSGRIWFRCCLFRRRVDTDLQSLQLMTWLFIVELELFNGHMSKLSSTQANNIGGINTMRNRVQIYKVRWVIGFKVKFNEWNVTLCKIQWVSVESINSRRLRD